MKNRSKFGKLFFITVVISMMVATLVFVRQAAAESNSIIRLSLVNDSQFDFVLYIFGENHGEEY